MADAPSILISSNGNILGASCVRGGIYGFAIQGCAQDGVPYKTKCFVCGCAYCTECHLRNEINAAVSLSVDTGCLNIGDGYRYKITTLTVDAAFIMNNPGPGCDWRNTVGSYVVDRYDDAACTIGKTTVYSKTIGAAFYVESNKFVMSLYVNGNATDVLFSNSTTHTFPDACHPLIPGTYAMTRNPTKYILGTSTATVTLS